MYKIPLSLFTLVHLFAIPAYARDVNGRASPCRNAWSSFKESVVARTDELNYSEVRPDQFAKLGIALTDGEVASLNLAQTNRRAQKENLSLTAMEREGFFESDSTPVFNVKNGAEDPEQPMPFQIVRFPKAKTGAFIPKDIPLDGTADLSAYDGYIILLSGIGSDQSNARSLFNIGQTLMEGKNPALNVGTEKNPRKLKLLPVLLDATLNGLNSEAPSEFGHPLAAVEMVRSAHLFMKQLFPNGKAHLGGRSHGATIAAEYTSIYGDVETCTLVNPSPSGRSMHKKGWQATESSIARMVIGDGKASFNQSWDAFKQNGSKFTSIGVSPGEGFVHRFFYGSRKPVRTLILLGRNDPSYSPDYIDYIEKTFSPLSFAKINIYDFPEATAHDLWTRRDKTQFKRVINDMAKFILSEE